MTHTREEVLDATLNYFNNDELATNVFFKYALQDGRDYFLELSPDDMHDRLASEFARIENNYPNPLSYETIRSYFDKFKKIVPQGSPMYGIGNNKLISLANCVVLEPPEDDMSSIMETCKSLANLYKRRCGVGVDISKLRPELSPVNNSAEFSSGAWSFADLYSYVTRMVGQKNRRGALMLTMDVRHPDIKKFITCKVDRKKVTGANISVRLTDEFMIAVENNENFQLQFPVDSENPTVVEVVEAREIWDLIVKTATESAEPGLLFWDTVCKLMPADFYPFFKTVSVNPCAELALGANDSCRLISINLKWFASGWSLGEFDKQEFVETVRIATRLSDDLVDLEIEKLQKIINSVDTNAERALFGNLLAAAQRGRRTGLGTHGFADMLARMGFSYDSEEALNFTHFVYQIFCETAYRESINLAKERGSFPDWDWQNEKNCDFHKVLPPSLVEEMSKFGRRNVSLLTCAPTGSVSILSQTSSGIEPVFRNSYIRRRKLDCYKEGCITDETGDMWEEFNVNHHNLNDWLKDNESVPLPEFFTTSDEIDWIRRVAIQGAIQRYIDHSISNTVNLPKDTGPEIVGEIYMEAWKLGLKGVTVYVDGSRDGVLLTGREFKYHDAIKRPETLECDIHHVNVKGESWTILIGLMGDKPYEILGGRSSMIEISRNITKGFLHKKRFKTRPNRYDLEIREHSIIRDVNKIFDNPDGSVLTRMISLALRHGANPSFLCEQLLKDPDASFVSFSKVLSRVLKTYILNGTKVSSKIIHECTGQPEVVYQEGCATCLVCGWSKCG
jgi:ribonucleoside-diphosphate reductase alpha chain